MSMEQFYTRDKANEGIKVPLYAPDGSETGHWLRILGVDSDTFRKAEAEAHRRLAVIAAEKDKAKIEQAYDDMYADLRAHLVPEWSFEQDCTLDAVKEFFANAPQISDMANRLGGNRSLFFGSKSSSSKSSQGQSSSSTVSQKGQNKA